MTDQTTSSDGSFLEKIKFEEHKHLYAIGGAVTVGILGIGIYLWKKNSSDVAPQAVTKGNVTHGSDGTPNLHVVGLGNPLLDISVQVHDDELLNKYDLTLDNAILATDKELPIFEDLEALEPEYIGGGACLNSIRAAQWQIGQKGATSYFGAIGKDANGTTMRNCVRKSGVNGHLMDIKDVPTGKCAVIVKDKERSLVTELGACLNFDKSYLGRMMSKKTLNKAGIFYVCGFFLSNTTYDSVVELAEFAAQENKMFVFNISAVFVTTVYTEEMNNIIQYADVVICNEGESRAFAESQGWDSENLEEIAKKITELPKINTQRPRVAIITCGHKSTRAYVDGEFLNVPVPKVDPNMIVDTNGAGDSFVGGLLAGLAKRCSYKKAIEAGHATAAYTICHSGTDFEGESAFQW